MSEDWIPPDPDWWKVPFDPEDWLPPPEYQDLFDEWGPGGPFFNPNDPFGPGTEPPAGWGPDGPWWEPPPELPPGSSPFDIPPGETPWGWGPDGPVYAPPEPPPIEPPPTAALVEGAAAETASVFALAALPVLALLFGGLLLPASRWGRPTWYWPWEDPCDDDFTELSIAFKELYEDAAAFTGKPSRRGASETLSQASYVIRVCQQFLRECPGNSHAATAKQMLAAAEQERDACLDYLATH